MELKLKLFLITIFFGLVACISCSKEPGENILQAGRKPIIEPDYCDVTIPPNIAPMNFIVREDASFVIVTATSETTGTEIKIKSKNGTIKFPERSWKKLLGESKGAKIKFQVYSSGKDSKVMNGFDPFYMYVSNDMIDPYLAYRLINPGYYSWSEIRIMQRCIENFWEAPIIDNQILDKNCANCHSFNNNMADRFMIHIRGSLGGTYFVDDGKITRTDPKIDAMPGSATYPSWHPGGRYMAYSSNQVKQSFYSVPEKCIEVFDLVSSLILYDREKNEIISINDRDTTRYLQTFPSWSPDGKYLYFCRALQYISASDPTMDEIKKTHYDLARKSFDPETRIFGETEVVFDASGINKSASFPRISPDSKYLIFTLADYGTFPIWHKEADLYMLDMKSGIAEKMNINSDETDSYHTWSTNGKWLVFSSKRVDGRSARPHFAHIDSDGNQGKPFVLPQKDPTLYDRMLQSFNIPEFVNGRINVGPRDFLRATKQAALKANAANPLDSLSAWEKKKINIVPTQGEKIHE